MIATLALDNNDCYIRSGEQGPLHSLWVAMIGDIHGFKPYESKQFGAMDATKPYKLLWMAPNRINL